MPPLTEFVNPIALTLVVLVGALVCFVGEWFPADIVALIVAVALMMLGLVTPEEGISGFSSSATIAVMAMFVLSAGIAKTGLLQQMRDFLDRYGGRTVSRQIAIVSAIVGPITAFINNTAVVAVFLPIVEDWCRKRKVAPSKLLIPLSFATILGGTLTTIGTSTNILASDLSDRLGYGAFGLFEFTRLGIGVFCVGMVYMVAIAPSLLPERQFASADLQAFGLREYVSELVVSPQSSLIGQTLRQSRIQRKFDIDVLEIVRDGTYFAQPLSDKLLVAGDILIVRGGKDDLLAIRDQRGLDLLPHVKFAQGTEEEAEFGSAEDRIGEVLILSNSRLVGTTLKELRFRQRYNATVLAIRRGEATIQDRLGKVPLRFGDLLLVQGPKDSFLGLQTSRELLVLEQRDAETLRSDKAWIALAIGVGVVAASGLNLFPLVVSALAGVVCMVFTGCLRPGEVYGSVRWDIIFLLAGLIPLGIAMEKSGTTAWLAQGLVALGGGLSGYWMLLASYSITTLLTEVLSNNASVVLMVPLAVEVAETLELNPMAFIFAVTIAASSSFITPIGYQTNTMVYGPGGYRFLDFARVGLPLNLLLVFSVPLLVVWLYGL